MSWWPWRNDTIVAEPPGSAGERILQEQFGTRARAERFYADQMRSELNERMIAFIGRMDMMFIGTARRNGECGVSFRAGEPGFVRVPGPKMLLWPELRGNGVKASLGNITENPHVALGFFDFFDDLIGLHVNGRAAVVSREDALEVDPCLPPSGSNGRRPEHWVLAWVDEAYIHCRKHLPALQRCGTAASRQWGTDDPGRKGGDYFGTRRPDSQR
jgi:uncharacterized protein